MELKDVILSTIAELGEDAGKGLADAKISSESLKKVHDEIAKRAPASKDAPEIGGQATTDESFLAEERAFLERIRERILVLFEGFQSPNNRRVEAKVDLTLNFLEYLLATLDERIETLKKP
ncbi:CiaD-like domain-containing protein [Hydrogenimonas urashimensis]|uniref:CiaD-like domain-containing protein n=1 Tax=Hydrogenimonas urashimensis TaxID=2740515 RepID=UPI0019160397|nr:hypothetical protein [Hydrogenimonas urashimensis]